MNDTLFMKRALELALIGKGSVSPNPMVGCVIVHDGKIIGEGWHRQYGGPHAEVNAVESVKDKSLLTEATVYVTLEPCSHFGKTPPCADLLVRHKVKKVIVCNNDPNPLVAGKGLLKLQEAGIEVSTGLLEKEGRELNKRFFTFMEKKRPYIVLKWAQTSDGFIARSNFDSKWISNPLARKLVHKWRGEEDAIMVGKNTALQDNPRLNTRDWSGKNPVRLVVDRNLSLPLSLNLFDGSQPTICYNTQKTEKTSTVEWVQISTGQNMIQDILADLYTRKIQSVLVEGGSFLLNEFINQQLFDEARVFVSPVCFYEGIPAPSLPLLEHEPEHILDNRLYTIKPSTTQIGV